MLNKIPSYIQNTPWQNHLWRLSGDDKVVYLTFDDGPTPEITDRTLEILEQYQAKATFFCLGRNAEHHPEVIRKIAQKGHRLGNHSYSHLKGFRTSVYIYLEDVKLAARFLDTKLFRPPYGRIRRKQAKRITNYFQIVMWDILSHDYNRKISPEKCYRNVIRNVRPGSIIVFHDSVKAAPNMLKALPETLKKLSEEGYRFESIPYTYGY